MDCEGVRIEKDGIYAFDWDMEQRVFVKKKPDDDRIIWCLRQYCEIAEDVTLGDIFRLVDELPTLKAVIAAYSWCGHITEFHEQAKQPTYIAEETDDDEPLTHLEIYWHVAAGQAKKVNYFDMLPSFHAYGDKGTAYSVSYSPMNTLAHLPVKLNTDFRIYKKPHKPGEEPIYQAKASFSLLNVLDAIYDDISFHGGPADNAKFVEEMKDRVIEIKEQLERGEEPKSSNWREIFDGEDDED